MDLDGLGNAEATSFSPISDCPYLVVLSIYAGIWHSLTLDGVKGGPSRRLTPISRECRCGVNKLYRSAGDRVTGWLFREPARVPMLAWPLRNNSIKQVDASYWLAFCAIGSSG